MMTKRANLLLRSYDSRIADNVIRDDPHQRRAVARLDELYSQLTKEHDRTDGLWGWFRKQPSAPRGVYMHGPVGRGKSMVMDMFFESVPITRKQRIHFHAFMASLHQRLHEQRKDLKTQDVLQPVARAIAQDVRLLCFDEFHVNNIVDAMVLGRLFTALFDEGVVVVATSNWPPDRLYEKGLQRHLFLPFIELLKQRLDVVPLYGELDYRLNHADVAEVWLDPLGIAATARLNALFGALTDQQLPALHEVDLGGGRKLHVPKAVNRVGQITFEVLCGGNFGASDYNKLADHFHSLVIEDIPKLDESRRNEARRFMTLIDIWYERKRRLFASAEMPPDELYSGDDASFEFQRTVSRLTEMTTRAWLDQAIDD